MSLPTKPIEDVLKDAQEVNSLETADRMGVIGENGELKKVSLNTIKDVHTTSFRISNNQWLRFAKYTYSVSPIGLILLSHTWNAINPQSTALVVSSPSGSELSPINVSVLCNTPSPSFNAIRCVADGNNRYLEVRFAKTTTNNPVIRVVGLSLEVVPYSISTASDSDVINTVSLISGWGGVKYCSSIIYAISLKGGGLRDEGDERTYQRPHKECGSGCDGRPYAVSRRFEQSYPWDIQDSQQQYSQLSQWSILFRCSDEYSECCRKFDNMGSSDFSCETIRTIYKNICKQSSIWKLDTAIGGLASERRAAA